MKSLLTLTTVLGGSFFTTTYIESLPHSPPIEVPEPDSEPILVKPNILIYETQPILVKPTVKRFTVEDAAEELKKRNETKAWDDMVEGVKFFEGYREKPYICSGGVKTIGYGHTGKFAKTRSKISKIEAEALLIEELMDARENVMRIVRVPLSEAQIAALTSFTFNCGQGALKALTDKNNRLNDGNYTSVEQILPLYRKASGKVSKGLVKRRAWEKELWVSN